MSDRRFPPEKIARLRDPQRISHLEVPRVVDLCLDGIEAASVVDVGTGSALWAEAFAARGLAVAGADISPEMLEVARQFVPGGDFRQGPAEAIPFEDGAGDLAFIGLVLHEVDDFVGALREARRVARQRVAVLEWPYRVQEFGPPLEHRLAPEDVFSYAEQAGGFATAEVTLLEHVALYRFAR
ncbi:MAG: class I SAM-dependent methyltransferase [Anaerolineae bacterium]|nr:class I SAM-dependent methyltransferase [Anaerolineae bacterium]